MKKINFLIITIVTLSLVLGTATVSVNKISNESVGSVSKLSINSQEDVYGLQFEIKYNTEQVELNNITTPLQDFTFEYKIKDGGYAKGLLFSMQGIALVNSNNLSDLLDFNFISVNNYKGSSIVEFTEFILAGQHGTAIEVSASPFEVNTDDFIPVKTALNKNYPNPFNPTTQIEYSIANSGLVSLVVYALNGAEVKTLVSEVMDAGQYTSIWNGINNQGNTVASGRYILKMTTNDYTETITMTLLK